MLMKEYDTPIQNGSHIDAIKCSSTQDKETMMILYKDSPTDSDIAELIMIDKLSLTPILVYLSNISSLENGLNDLTKHFSSSTSKSAIKSITLEGLLPMHDVHAVSLIDAANKKGVKICFGAIPKAVMANIPCVEDNQRNIAI